MTVAVSVWLIAVCTAKLHIFKDMGLFMTSLKHIDNAGHIDQCSPVSAKLHYASLIGVSVACNMSYKHCVLTPTDRHV